MACDLLPVWIKPETKFWLGRLLRPLALCHIPIFLCLAFVGAGFWAAAIWAWLGGIIGLVSACPRCRYSIYWEESRRWRLLLAKPHSTCTRCGFSFLERPALNPGQGH